MTYEEMASLVEACTYKPGWSVKLTREAAIATTAGDLRPYIQVCVDVEADASMDSLTRQRAPWKGGKKYLSYHMCRQEIVGAVFGALKDAELHEIHEWFRYKGCSIYNPHLDPNALVTIARKAASFNVRENAMNPE